MAGKGGFEMADTTDNRWPDLRDALDNYARHRTFPGRFLQACLENDLAGAYYGVP